MNRLKELRLENRLTLRELAEILKMSHSAISLAENGKRNLTDIDIDKICEYFNCSSDYLLCLSNERNQTTTSDVNIAFYNQHGIVTDEQKKEVESFIAFIKSKENK
jgi:transcriptional regulator with XRE-family HTH domain